MSAADRTRIVAELADFDRLLEVGVGLRFEVATALIERGCAVTTIDIVDRESPPAVRYRRADVVSLAAVDNPVDVLGLDEPPDAVYACNLPAELQRPTVDLASRLRARCLFTTLGFEEPSVPVERRTVGGETLYEARSGSGRE